MTRFVDPSRPQAYGQPCWLGTRQQLPDVHLQPSADRGFWRASICVPSDAGGNSFCWLHHHDLSRGEVQNLLDDWEASPEETIARWFDRQPPAPEALKPTTLPILAGVSAEELGL